MGGVAGHAGLFGDAYDMACVMQMLLNRGEWNGRQMIKKETIELFTDYHSAVSRRGYGFDKPEKDNATRAEAYPAKSSSAKMTRAPARPAVSAAARPLGPAPITNRSQCRNPLSYVSGSSCFERLPRPAAWRISGS